MKTTLRKPLQNFLRRSVCLLILVVTLQIVSGYVGYFPPDFSVDFLSGREAYFWSRYQWAFYPHLMAGPTSLILGMFLTSGFWRRKRPLWHAIAGRVQVVNVLFIVVPSGFFMGFYAQGDEWAQRGFFVMSTMTAVCVIKGWRGAMRRDYRNHQLWMTRCYLMLCAAVVTRIVSGLFVVAGVYGEWTHTLTAWGSWLIPLTAFESMRACKRRSSRIELMRNC